MKRSRATCRKRHRVAIAGAFAFCAATTAFAAPGLGAPQHAAADRTTIEHARTDFTDAEIADGLFKLAFGADLQFAGNADRIRRYDGPVRVYIDNRAKPDRSAEAAKIVADIDRRIAHLEMAVTRNRADANMVLTLVHDRDLAGTIRRIYGSARAKRIMRQLDPQCLAGFAKDDAFRIVHAEVIVVVDAGDLTFRDCVYEEVLQALGPIHDNASIPWTTFNPNVQLGRFGTFDQFILNTMYHPQVRPGMRRAEIETLLPRILPEVRAFVTATETQ